MMRLLAVVLAVFAFAAPLESRAARDVEDLQELVEEAKFTVSAFRRDENMTWFRENLHRAKGLLIIPNLVKGGFILGGSGGNGVMLAQDVETGAWSFPAFYTMGSVTLGLQIGGEVSEIVLMIMTEDGRDAMLGDEFKLGGDVSVAVGPIGAGGKAQTADVLAFSRTKGGLYGGLNIEGAVIATREDWNRTYYGRDVRTVDIISKRTVSKPDADALRMELTRTATAGKKAGDKK